MKILVVHRQKNTVDAIMSVLSGCNTVFRNSESGLDGLLTSRIEYFDLIICGTDLPVVTGFELVRSIRTHSANRDAPVILITDSEHDGEKAEYLGKALNVAGVIRPEELEDNLFNLVAERLKIPITTEDNS